MSAVKQKLAKILANEPHGDHIGIMINRHEAQTIIPQLRAMGGADVVNPQTGMHQFYEDAGGEGGHGGPVGQGGHNDLGGSNRSGGNGGNAGSGRNGGYATGTTVGGMPNPNPYGPNSPTSKALQAQGVSPDNAARALQSQHDYVNASQGYANRTGMQKLGDMLAGLLPGVNTTKPTLSNPSTYAQGTYHQSLNPAAAAAAVAGFATGIPGASTLGEQLIGRGYNALGGNNYSFGGGGIDPQTGQATSGWGGTGPGFGFGGGSAPAHQANGTQSNGRGSDALGPSAAPASVGTNAGAPIQGAAGVPAAFIPPDVSVPAQKATNPYQGTPWESYPGNIWIGGGVGSRAIA